MRSFHLTKFDLDPKTVSDTKSRKIYSFNNTFNELENKLNASKNDQEEYYENTTFKKVSSYYDAFKAEKGKIMHKYCAQNVTNAWLKMYELCTHFHLMKRFSKKCTHFDNAAFPGSFLLAGNHYAKASAKINTYDWYGSSWIDSSKDLLNDSYDLYKNHPNRWLMNREVSGNVTDEVSLRFWAKKLGGKVDLYTSDLGFETGSNNDYTRQELDHVHPNFGQVLAGLLTLKKGGHLVIKQYTLFQPLNITLYVVLLQLFTEVHICKPMTSRPTNSETYVVCKDYRINNTGNLQSLLSNVWIKAIWNKVLRYTHIPLLYKKDLPPQFIVEIQTIVKSFVIDQIMHLERRIIWYKSIKDYPTKQQIGIGKKKLIKWHRQQINSWHRANPVYKIDFSDKIKRVRSFQHRRKCRNKFTKR